MTLVPADLSKWDLECLLRAFEEKVELQKTMVGTLYPSILHDELTAIGQEGIRRTGMHPNWWREKGVVPSSWTDELGIAHNWQHWVIARKPDDPTRMVTCMQCIAKEFK
jgi:hypothetical protein